MEVQVLSPSPAVDFNYDSSSTSPYATAPSSPQSSIPFTWEEKPGIPKQDNYNYLDEDESSVDTEFAFGYLERHSISAADELFDGGKIKPLKPPPRLHFSNTNNDSPVSPKSPKLRFKELSLSPRSKKNDFDPFSEALKQTQHDHEEIHTLQKRGRQKTVETTKRRNTKVSRSLSPLNYYSRKNNNNSTTMEQTSSSSSPTWYNKWNLKNLLLFRSASEGSVTSARKQADSKKYTLLKKNNNNDQTTSFSFRSTDSSGSSSIQVSADNDDFSTTNEGTKNKKTTSTNLSYKSAGLMGCLRFNQNAGSVHEISRGINFVMKG